jgi:predicted 2-oxoglutarate/Fe(II)-dependent dioxygenase YbiX
MTWLIPAWLKRAVAGLVAGVVLLWGAWVMGRRDGTQTSKAKAAQRAADDLATAKGVQDVVQKLGDDDVRKSLARWMRPSK